MARPPEGLRRLSRRDFLRLSVVVGTGAVSSACFHRPEWQIIKPVPFPTSEPQGELPTVTPVPVVEEKKPENKEYLVENVTDLVEIVNQFPVFDEKDPYYFWYRCNGGQKLLEPLDIPRGTVLLIPDPGLDSPPLPEITVSPEGWSVKLSERTTSLAGSSEKRLTNIRVGVEKLNGRIIAPFELFSTQEALGPFDESSGYVEGWGYSEKGGVWMEVPMMAGGVCQIPATFFKPVVESGMLVIIRHWHEFYSSNYGEWEATVTDTKDFTFRNLYDFPLQIRAKIDEEAQILTIGLWSPYSSPYSLIELTTLYNLENPDGSRDTGVRQKVVYGSFVRVREFHSHYIPKPK